MNNTEFSRGELSNGFYYHIDMDKLFVTDTNAKRRICFELPYIITNNPARLVEETCGIFQNRTIYLHPAISNKNT